jgi:hypothetical protein
MAYKICIFDDTTNLIKPIDMALADGGVSIATVEIPTTSAPGNFTVPHGLFVTPQAVDIQMTSGGQLWFQGTPYDSTNLYLVASDAGVSANAACFLEGAPESSVEAFSLSSITLVPPNGGTTYALPITPLNTAGSFYFVNGVKRVYGVYYTFSGNSLVILASDPPQSGDTHELYADATGLLTSPYTTAPVSLLSPNGGTNYLLPFTPADDAGSFYFVNGVKRVFGTYYTFSGDQLVILASPPPQSGDTHELYVDS